MIPDASPQRITFRRSLIPSKKKKRDGADPGSKCSDETGDEHEDEIPREGW
jgi:hypothetical protein